MSSGIYPHKNLIVILGPTGSGKSSLAVKLAGEFSAKGGGVEIVSADSRQIYQEMNIGTAKITKREMEGIPHYLIDVVKPNQNFTLAEYKGKAVKIIKDIQQRGKLPFLVGGTGLYIQSIVENLDIPKVKPDKKLREKLEKKTNRELFNQLKKLDPAGADFIDKNNKRRLIRALEVCLLTQKPFSKQRKRGRPLFNVLQLGLKVEKKELEKKIKKRTEQMLRQGLIDEVKNLVGKYGDNLPSYGIGYQEIIQYLKDEISLKQAKQLIILHTLQYARRQMTWFKRDQRTVWLPSAGSPSKLIFDLIRP